MGVGVLFIGTSTTVNADTINSNDISKESIQRDSVDKSDIAFSYNDVENDSDLVNDNEVETNSLNDFTTDESDNIKNESTDYNSELTKKDDFEIIGNQDSNSESNTALNQKENNNTADNDSNNEIKTYTRMMAAKKYTITIIAHPYAQVYSFNSRNTLMPANKGLAPGSRWGAYLGDSGNYWKVATNEYIQKRDATTR
ncbi:hypothetical protein FD31_GL002203 [Companilactobacillus nantensis DSM 16982]|uniref:Surface layer protein A domain-containing protein n=2 Tax=Companilactobacillus nantensis TaxID=305793 RepID=A0A0R1WGX6_9LACO|nr:hypothetical protein FD31_GL002203 [Companilactobacillus nantensis DSM 16982]